MTVLTWSDDRVEQLKKLWEAGLSASQIAAELGNVTRNAVIGKVHRLGLSGRAKSPSSAAPRQRKARPAQHMMRVSRPVSRGNTALAHAFEVELEPDPIAFDNVVPRETGRDTRIICWAGRALRGRGAAEEGLLARPERPSRCTLPITAFRVTFPSSAAIWLAESPASQSFFSCSTRSSDQVNTVIAFFPSHRAGQSGQRWRRHSL